MSHEAQGESVIDAAISIRRAARELGEDPKVIKGFALGMGIVLVPTGTSYDMTPRDFERLRKGYQLWKSRAVTVAG
jgi:hypothetical protein